MDSNQIIGAKNQREVRRLRPIVEQIVSIEESWNGKGQDFLLEKTREWQSYLHRFLPMDLPPVRIVEAAPKEELESIASRLNARFESLKNESMPSPRWKPLRPPLRKARPHGTISRPSSTNSGNVTSTRSFRKRLPPSSTAPACSAEKNGKSADKDSSGI